MSGRWRRLPVLAALLAALAAMPSLRGEFVYDDYPYVVDNADLAGGWDRVPRLFRVAFPSEAPERGLYRPVTSLTYRLDRSGGTRGPTRYHVTNLVLAFALGLAAHEALRRVLSARSAVAGAFLFAVHPVHVESVAWITGRSELLSALGALLAFAWAVDTLRSGGRGRAVAAGVALLLGALAKENALVVLPLLGLVAFVERRTTSPARVALAFAPLLVASGAVLALRWSVLGAFGPVGGETVGGPTLASRGPLIVAALGEHLRLLLWPHPLSIERMPRAPGAWSDPGVVAGAVTIVAWVGGVWALRRRRSVRLLGLWPIVALAPVMHFVPIGETVAERFLLLPSLGVAGVVGAALIESGQGRNVRRALLVALVLAGFVVSWRYASEWRTEEAVWRHAVAVEPGSATAWTALGDSYARRDWPDKAEPFYQKALELDPGLTVARLALAQALDDRGRPDLALVETQEAVRLAPDHAKALNNLGARLARAGRVPEAEEMFRRAIARAPGYAPALRNAAFAAEDRGDRREAVRLWERARAADPRLPLASEVFRAASPESSSAR
ncbi:MAG: tetratricopeptide repeat protein [Gemmatimonadetes bacterium]|nr:tetratricopeptide repeat protein [Gemmatimonadota bacterium]